MLTLSLALLTISIYAFGVAVMISIGAEVCFKVSDWFNS